MTYSIFIVKDLTIKNGPRTYLNIIHPEFFKNVETKLSSDQLMSFSE